MLILSGGYTYSDFRKKQLLETLRSVVPEVEAISVQNVYFVDSFRPLSATESQRLVELIGDSSKELKDLGDPEEHDLLVTPRAGTISAWSSKATDIIHNTGLASVRRVEHGRYIRISAPDSDWDSIKESLITLLFDRMTEQVWDDLYEAKQLFSTDNPAKLKKIELGDDAIKSLQQANETYGLALSEDEIEYLAENYSKLGRNPSDAELMMFAQANSEHCRHKIFNATWTIDDNKQDDTLFGMIRNTHQTNPKGVLVAYSDNSSVIEGHVAYCFDANPITHHYEFTRRPTHILMKVETHNHPTAISPFPGAATGSGGEIRDEAATGTGSKTKAGLSGFNVSNLKIPELHQSWEIDYGKPDRIASPLDIMIEAPIGSAAFNNEFGRPNLAGYFRTYEQTIRVSDDEFEVRGYHKPIMLAGGMGCIREEHLYKHAIPAKTPIVVLGGPAMHIGLGGGAASSMATGQGSESLDFASVQRGNPEMERRAQEVINQCVALGELSPVLSIHDVGAGGLSNAIPEIINDAEMGGLFELREIPNAEISMSPMVIWCNEAQERFVVAVNADKMDQFEEFCKRERCPYAIVGYATENRDLVVNDNYHNEPAVNLPLEVLLGKAPRMHRDTKHRPLLQKEFVTQGIELDDAIEKVLSLPTVAAKNFLITIGDRTITGLVARDQMVGPWQVPVADVAVTLSDYHGYTGEAMAIGERPPIALIDPEAAARIAVAESITNIAAADITNLSDIKLSANWMAAANHHGEDAGLFDAVKAIGKELCPDLGICIPVGKDSMSMKTVWQDDGEEKAVTSPISLVITAFAPVSDTRKTLTPELDTKKAESSQLLLIDLSNGNKRMGGSCLSQVYQQLGDKCPDVDNTELLKNFFNAIQKLNQENLLLAYHDRSDGGLLVTLLEMAFASHCGLTILLNEKDGDPLSTLFNEELGVVIQVEEKHKVQIEEILETFNLLDCTTEIAAINADKERVTIMQNRRVLYSRERCDLQSTWQQTSYSIQRLRDNPKCADSEFSLIKVDDPGLHSSLTFDSEDNVAMPYITSKTRPKMAILREQGVNGHVEMAAAFDRAGFDAIDVHMTDLQEKRTSLSDFQGLVACGGFSYGDVLGAGGGWAKNILFNPQLNDEFSAFFQRPDTFSLGVCNGCQMLSLLKDLIPGADHWPTFKRNLSEQYEARLSLVQVQESPSIFLKGMEGSVIPVPVAHGEGRASFTNTEMDTDNVCVQYVDNHRHVTEYYPQNPNGSPQGIAGLTSFDGRATIMMPHPERVIRSIQYSWKPKDWGEDGPWLRMFRNARVWVD